MLINQALLIVFGSLREKEIPTTKLPKKSEMVY